MAETATTGWYRIGTVTVTSGSTKVSGNGTRWLTAGINPGATFRVDAKSYACEVKEVVSDTEIQLVKPYYGQTASGQTYSVDRNFQSTLEAEIASKTVDLMGKFQKRYDLDMSTITGKSAYELAVENGYVGTQAQWLEGLKASGEWSRLDARTELLTYHNAGSHNARYRGKALVWSDALSSVIRSGAFSNGSDVDIYPGDYFTFSNIPYSYPDEPGANEEAEDEETGLLTRNATYSGTFRVADCDYGLRCGDSDLTTHHIVVVPDAPLYNAKMNDTNVTTGGYVNSKMRTLYLKRAEAIVKACFGEGHVLSRRNLLVNAVTEGRPSGHGWYTSVVDLMNEPMVYGSFMFESGASNGTVIPYRYTTDKSQLSMFKHRHDLIIVRNQWWWLRDVVSAACFAGVYGAGFSSYSIASYVLGVRPAALIY